VISKNKETQEEEIFELNINKRDIACLYKDQYGVAVTTYGGKFYRVKHTLKELEELYG
jgi:hypothetical protein